VVSLLPKSSFVIIFAILSHIGLFQWEELNPRRTLGVCETAGRLRLMMKELLGGSSDCHCRGQISIPGQPVWDLW